MEPTNQIVQVKIEDIVPNRYQPRIKFNEQDIKELSDSIKQHGIIQPLTVRQIGQKFEIIAGERRCRAAAMAGLKTVPAIILNISDQTSAELAIIENIQRKNLNAIEEAQAYKKLIDISNMTQEELATHIGKTQATIANKLRLLNLAPEVQNAVLEGQISERHARTLLQVNNSELQREILQKIISDKLTVKSTEQLISTKYKNIDINSNDVSYQNSSSGQIKNNNLSKITGDENKMNEQNYNNLMQQPAMPIPDTPIPEQKNEAQQKSSIFNNNFFPSLDDEKTNINLNPWNAPNQQPQEPLSFPEPNAQTIKEQQNVNVNSPSVSEINPWNVPNESPSPITPETVNKFGQNPTVNQPGMISEQYSNFTASSNENMPNIAQTPNSWNIASSPMMQSNDSSTIEPTPLSNPLPDSSMGGTSPDYSNIPNYNQPANSWDINSSVMPQSNNSPVTAPPTFNSNPEPLAPNYSSNNQVPNFIEQPMPGMMGVQDSQNTTQSAPANTNINDSINKVRAVISEIEATGSKVQSSEIDMDTEYQIIIKIQKGDQ